MSSSKTGRGFISRFGRVRFVGFGIVAALEAITLAQTNSESLGATSLSLLVALVALLAIECVVRIRTLARVGFAQTKVIDRESVTLEHRLDALEHHVDATGAQITSGVSALMESLFGSSRAELTEASERTVKEITRHVHSEAQQSEALMRLFADLKPRFLLPGSGGWAMDARTLVHVVDIIEREKPKIVVELGSGASTIWLGYALEALDARLISIDHDPAYAALTQEQILRHGLEDTIELRQAPLAPIVAEPDAPLWYDLKLFDGIAEVDLLVVDGPPKSTGPRSREPALAALAPRLASHCTVVLDDSERADEVETVEKWLEDYPDFVRSETKVSRLAVLRRSPKTS